MTNQRNTENDKPQIGGNDGVGSPQITGATPGDGAMVLYQGQKVPLSVGTSGMLTGKYKTATFQLQFNDDFTHLQQTIIGFVVHPDSQGKVQQTVSIDNDTYRLNAVVYGTASQTNYTDTMWNISIAGDNPSATITLSGSQAGNYGYFSKNVLTGALYEVVPISGGTHSFTTDVHQAIRIAGYQVSDTQGNAMALQFSAFVMARDGDLTHFDFWDTKGNKIPKVKVDQKDKFAWIDSGADGKFSFYVTSSLPSTSQLYCDTLNIMVGNEKSEIAQVVVGNFDSLESDSLLPAPYAPNAAGSWLTLTASDTIVNLSIPEPLVPDQALQVGDMLVSFINNQLQANVSYIIPDGYSGGRLNDCFSVPAAVFNVSEAGIDNTLQYVVLRGLKVTGSSTTTITVNGSPASGNVPEPPVQIYTQPIIEEDPGCLDLDYTMVANGLHVKIPWSGWAPNLNDTLTLYIHFSGWNCITNTGDVVVPIKFPPIQTKNLTDGFTSKLIDYSVFAGFYKGPQGQSSRMLMQYEVPGGGANKNVGGYSVPTMNMGIDTVPPGGIWFD